MNSKKLALFALLSAAATNLTSARSSSLAQKETEENTILDSLKAFNTLADEGADN